MPLSYTVTGARELSLRFEQFPEHLRERFRARLERIKGPLVAAVQAAEPVRSGKMRAATGGGIYEHPNRIALVVGVRIDAGAGKTKRGSVDAGKVAALNYGSHRQIDLRGHLEQRTNFWGRLLDPVGVQIAAHRRQTNIDAYNFLGGPQSAMRAEEIAELQSAVDETIAEGE
jgi:hypothetical protein